MRFQVASHDLLWLDELHTGWVVDAPGFSDIASRASDGNQTPFFFWITYLLIQLPIQPELGLRLASLLAGIALNVIAPIWVWRWFGSRLGTLLTAALIASNLDFIYYSTEARPYALIQLLGLLQFGYFFRLLWPAFSKSSDSESANLPSNIKPQILFSLLSLAMLYTHLTSAWLLITEALALAVCFFRTPRLIRRVELWLPAIMTICGGFLPFALVTHNIYSRRDNWELVSSIPNLISNNLPELLIVVLAPALLIIGHAIFIKQQPELAAKKRQQLGLILLWALIPFSCVVGLTLTGVAPLALRRYTLIGAAALPIFAGCCTAYLPSIWQRILLATLLFSSLIFTGYCFSPTGMNPFNQGGSLPHFRLENWQTVIEKINSESGKQEYPVFLFANIIEDADAMETDDLRFQNYLLFPLSWPYSLNRTYPTVSAGPTLTAPHFRPTQIQKTLESEGCWVIVRGNKDLAEQIGFELEMSVENKMAENPATSLTSIKTQFYETADSPVYLISLTW